MIWLIVVALLPTLLAFALRPLAPWYRILLWGACVWPALIAAALSWLLTPAAVRRAVPVIPDAEDLSPTTRARLRSHLVNFARRLPPWARWMELRDDQILPPGRYEPRMAKHGRDWEAQSIAMLRSNPANTFDTWIGLRIFTDTAALHSTGPWADDTTLGIWRGAADGAWQVMGLISLPGPRNLQINLGYVVRDLFDNPEVERPIHSARYRLPVVRFPLKSKD